MILNDQSFIFGCVGAIAPEILRFYQLRFSKNLSFPNRTEIVIYIFCVTPMILIGGVFAWVLEPSSKFAALHIGIGTPFIINSILKKGVIENIVLPEETAKKVSEQELMIKGLQQDLNDNKSLLAKAEEDSRSSTSYNRENKSFLDSNLSMSISFLSSRISEIEISIHKATDQLDKYKQKKLREDKGKKLAWLNFIVKFIRAI